MEKKTGGFLAAVKFRVAGESNGRYAVEIEKSA